MAVREHMAQKPHMWEEPEHMNHALKAYSHCGCCTKEPSALVLDKLQGVEPWKALFDEKVKWHSWEDVLALLPSPSLSLSLWRNHSCADEPKY